MHLTLSSTSESIIVNKSVTCLLMQTLMFISAGMLSYAAFGDISPGNIFTSFGFFNPYWLVAAANVLVWGSLAGAYQLYMQVLFKQVERQLQRLLPNLPFIYTKTSFHCPGIGEIPVSTLRLVTRSTLVCLTTVIVSHFPILFAFTF